MNVAEMITVEELLEREGAVSLLQRHRPPQHLALKTYYVTFGASGWIKILAPDFDTARDEATRRWGGSSVLSEYKPAGGMYPAGEILRVVLEQ